MWQCLMVTCGDDILKYEGSNLRKADVEEMKMTEIPLWLRYVTMKYGHLRRSGYRPYTGIGTDDTDYRRGGRRAWLPGTDGRPVAAAGWKCRAAPACYRKRAGNPAWRPACRGEPDACGRRKAHWWRRRRPGGWRRRAGDSCWAALALILPILLYYSMEMAGEEWRNTVFDENAVKAWY